MPFLFEVGPHLENTGSHLSPKLLENEVLLRCNKAIALQTLSIIDVE